MPKIIIYFIILFIITKPYKAQNFWQQIVNYNINIQLDDRSQLHKGYVKMEYINNSPDTLNFIWIHLWPNAYKNDKTAFSNQLLNLGNTEFYFSKEEKKGYINQLNFTVNKQSATLIPHPKFIDIAQLKLNEPLLPKQKIEIESPFQLKLPDFFSRSGTRNYEYAFTQWYPKAAVYDKDGWHPMPYLEQGEFYNNFGNYTVNITVPKQYVVAATGVLQNTDELNWLLNNRNIKNHEAEYTIKEIKIKNPKNGKTEIKKLTVLKNDTIQTQPLASNDENHWKTLSYKQDSVTDFAWFASTSLYTAASDIVINEKSIKAIAYIRMKEKNLAQNLLLAMENTIKTRSNWLHNYPFKIVQVVSMPQIKGGMEYPTITNVYINNDSINNENVIEHEIGHNWFPFIVQTNERDFPWLDEGLNTFYDMRYFEDKGINLAENLISLKNAPNFLKKRLPDNIAEMQKIGFSSLKSLGLLQPINTASQKMSGVNYNIVSYYQTYVWLKMIENELGREKFDNGMKYYFNENKFKLADKYIFQQALEKSSGISLQKYFDMLDKPLGLNENDTKRNKWKTNFLFNLKNEPQTNYLGYLPILGYNKYDGVGVGLLLHNITLPLPKFKFIFAPIYSTKSKTLNGWGNINYTHTLNNNDNLDFTLAVSKFSINQLKFLPSKKILKVFRIVPSVKYNINNEDKSEQKFSYIQYKLFMNREEQLKTTLNPINGNLIYSFIFKNNFIHNIKYYKESNRTLFPYNIELSSFILNKAARLQLTGNYFFNFKKWGGVDARFFAGKMFYYKAPSFRTRADLYPAFFTLNGARGNEDFTYSGYFLGRNQFDDFLSNQMMVNNGGFKVSTDLLANKIGKSDNWLMALNLNTQLKNKLPIYLFADIGTFAESWQQNSTTPRLLFDAGLQVRLSNLINFYIPLAYSKVFRDYYRSTFPKNEQFIKRLSFSIDLSRLKPQSIVSKILK